MRKQTSRSRLAMRSVALIVCVAVASLLMAGCAPAYNTRPGPGYYGGRPTSYTGGRGRQCYQGCGYVRQIRQVQLDSNHAVLGTVIGALVGGLVGNQVGGGSGKTLATVAGAAAGGYAGHQIGENNGRGNYGWQVVVQLNNGQYATVTQHNPPQVQVGEYVMVRNNEVYPY